MVNEEEDLEFERLHAVLKAACNVEHLYCDDYNTLKKINFHSYNIVVFRYIFNDPAWLKAVGSAAAKADGTRFILFLNVTDEEIISRLKQQYRIDKVCGENSFAEFIDYFKKESGIPFEINNNETKFVCPDRDSWLGTNPRQLFTNASSGCKRTCSFCINGSQNPHIHYRDINGVCSEMICTSAKTGKRRYFITDEAFNSNSWEKLHFFENRLQNQGLVYFAKFQADFLAALSAEERMRLQSSGLYGCYAGIESGSSAALTLFNKKTTVEINEKCIQTCRDSHLYLRIGFINLHPYNTLTELEENIEFLQRTQTARLSIMCQRYFLIPGTTIFENLQSDHLINRDWYENMNIYGYNFANPSIASLCRFLQEAKDRLIKMGYHEWDLLLENLFCYRTFSVNIGNPVLTDLLTDSIHQLEEYLYQLGNKSCSFMRQLLKLVRFGWNPAKAFLILERTYSQNWIDTMNAQVKKLAGNTYHSIVKNDRKHLFDSVL